MISKKGALFGWLVAMLLGMQLDPAKAEIPRQTLINPKEITSQLVFALQSGNQRLLYNWLESDALTQVLSATGGTGREPRLVSLGPVSGIEININSTTGNSFTFVSKVTHANGISSFTIAVSNATDRISSLKLDVLSSGTLSPVGHQSSNPISTTTSIRGPFGLRIQVPSIDAEILNTLRNQNTATGEVIRNPGQITGGNNSIIRNPAEIINTLRPSTENAPVAAPPFDPRVVEFLYATTRKSTTNNGVLSYTGDRGPLNFGVASIRIPEDHKIGRIELPFNWSILGFTIAEGSTNEKKHFIVRKLAAMTPEEWGSIIRAKSPKKALIFVHGFNNSFQDALFRNAQMIWDLQYPGLSVLFSWASGGEGADYFYDQGSATLARSEFIKLLSLLKDTYGIEEVNVIAHSMGNFVVLDALSNYAQVNSSTRIRELIMAAPDVDRDQFVQILPDVHKIAAGMTLYASSADKALALSRIPARVPRAGDVPPEGPVVLPNLETIDVTAVGDEIFGLNHSEFATNRVIMDDIKLILSTGMRPPNSRLSQIRAFPELPAVPTYWRYAP